MMGGCGGVNLEDERVMENEWSREDVSNGVVCMHGGLVGKYPGSKYRCCIIVKSEQFQGLERFSI